MKFVYDDFKSDYVFVRDVLKGKRPLTSMGRDDLKQLKKPGFWLDVLKEFWLLYWIILLAFLSGFFFASQYYQEKCNVHILETFYDADCDGDGNCVVPISPDPALRDLDNFSLGVAAGYQSDIST